MPLSSLIPVGAWIWETYGKDLLNSTADEAKDTWRRFKWKKAAKDYRDKIKRLYGTMQIMGMAQPVPLDDIFTDAYMLDTPTAFRRFGIQRLRESSSDAGALSNAQRISGLRLVTEKHNLFILGKPGAGKTTFLKYIALQAADQNLDKIPIFVSLKQWADSGLALMPFIAERFDICDFPDAGPFTSVLLQSGNAIVLFDGLDEVTQADGQRDRQTREMNNFIEKYHRAQCLITCRIAASHYSFERLSYVEIADFTEGQIAVFVGNWFRDDRGEKDRETQKRFLSEFELDRNKGLRDLARTPLLLTLLCLAFNETLTFPQRRAEIYQEALDALLKKWDATRRIKRDEIYRKLSLGHKENMLARIAAETFERNEYFISQSKLEKWIEDYISRVPPHEANEVVDGAEVLKSIEERHGILVERTHNVYSFSHLTFQEYLTSKYIVSNAEKGTLTNLVREHCSDGRWREVFLLTTSLLSDAQFFMTSFRRSIDGLLMGKEGLRNFLLWANKKSTIVTADSWLVRPAYVFMELSHPIHNRAFLDHLARDFFDHDFSQDLDYALNRALRHVIYAYGRNDGTRDFGLEFLNHFNNALRRARELGLDELTNALAALSPIYLEYDRVTTNEWLEFAAKFQALIILHRDVGHDWNLTADEEVQLANYLNATRLLQDCLELATMPPDQKKTMLNNLYLPPADNKPQFQP